MKATPVKTKSLLPEGTCNAYIEKYSGNENDELIRTHKILSFKEGEREVSILKWKLLYNDSGELIKSVFAHLLCTRYLQSINNTCHQRFEHKGK